MRPTDAPSDMWWELRTTANRAANRYRHHIGIIADSLIANAEILATATEALHYDHPDEAAYLATLASAVSLATQAKRDMVTTRNAQFAYQAGA